MKEIITDIQSLGVRVPKTIIGRSGGAGPAEGRAFLLDDIPVNVPIRSAYTKNSPYSLSEGKKGGYNLLKEGRPIATTRVVPAPLFYDRVYEDGIPFQKIALLHGKDCLATTVLQECANWKANWRCSFCATQISLNKGRTIARKTPQQLAAVAEMAVRRDGVRHMVMTSGTGDPAGSEIEYLAQCTATVKGRIDLPVHVQFIPPTKLALMDRLKQAGVDTVGIHIESFHEPTLKRVAPVKSHIGLARYEEAWQRAVALFGPNQVSSFLIVGLGEPPESVVRGSEVLADLGVYPFVVPLRPIPGSWLESRRPPKPERMQEIYSAVARILRRKGLTAQNSLAGCVRCGACSALATYEKPLVDITCHSARSDQERAAAFAIRQMVFVEEQGIFKGTDRDERDPFSIHIVARQGEEIVGTVRVFRNPQGSNGHWVGSRLAVHPEHRAFRVASTLVKEAMKRVKKSGCNVFTAHIQEQNIRFFKKLGWTPIGKPDTYHGYPHQQMQADLDRVPDDF
ncbi:MAG: MSMEG_0568 family radical SAM protein [Desulfosarcinaceae bacterium]|nr:MSMEG_0568 family radical SAM protein [Desulfosarcinaceae bacterium]